jgi:FtsZ-interacting cell division protein ZipA
MSTGLIIAIVVVALILIALFAFVLPRARKTAQVKKRERELEQRREGRAEEHRAEAAERRSEAEMAEQRARMAQTEAQRERAEAEMREQRAQMHERGMADDELIDESERDKFAGTSAMRDEPAPTRDDDSMRDPDRPMHEPASDYEQGRVDEAREREGRFARSPESERTDDPSRTGR